MLPVTAAGGGVRVLESGCSALWLCSYLFVTLTYLHLPKVIDMESLPMCLLANSETFLVRIRIFGTFLCDIVFSVLSLGRLYMFWIALFNQTHPLAAIFPGL